MYSTSELNISLASTLRLLEILCFFNKQMFQIILKSTLTPGGRNWQLVILLIVYIFQRVQFMLISIPEYWLTMSSTDCKGNQDQDLDQVHPLE